MGSWTSNLALLTSYMGFLTPNLGLYNAMHGVSDVIYGVLDVKNEVVDAMHGVLFLFFNYSPLPIIIGINRGKRIVVGFCYYIEIPSIVSNG